MSATATKARVGELVRLERRLTAIDPLSEYTLIGVYSFGKGIFHRPRALGAELGDYRFTRVHPGDLVVSNIQAWEGAIAVAAHPDDNCIASHRFLTYVPLDDSVIDVKYLAYFFLSDAGIELIRAASPGSVLRNRTLGIKAFESIDVPLPPLEEQRRTADHLDRLISASRRGVQRRMHARSISEALPSSLSRRPDLAEDAKVALGWKRVALGEIMALRSDMHVVSPDRVYPNIGILSYGRGVFEKEPIDGADTSARQLNRVQAGQFIYSRLFAFEGAYASVPDAFDGYFVSNEFPTFDVDTGVDARFLAAYFRSPSLWDQLSHGARGLGVRRQRIHPAALLSLNVWLPPLPLQEIVMRHVSRLIDYAASSSQALEAMGALEPAALNAAFAHLRA